MWRAIVPQLPVADVRRAQAYYRDVLGFEIAWLWQESFGAVFRDEIRIYFTKTEGPRPSVCCCIDVDDADAVHAEYRKRRARIVSPLETKPWGMREFTVEDEDGHLLRVGHGVKNVDEIPDFTRG